jgi:site-specific DNA-methyltransferase (adenine-specific)
MYNATYYEDENLLIQHGECIALMKELPDNCIDSIVTDPPYGLGFMGKGWDALPPGLEWARECLRVLKPGGHMLAFGGTRTWHRLAVAVEDAGFEIRDSIAWLYGSGFPKHRAALKPAFEPIVFARKPFKGSLDKNEAQYGTGALNIDDCRLDSMSDGPGTTPRSAVEGQRDSMAGAMDRVEYDGSKGRWPANVVLDEDMAEVLDEQTGTLTSGAGNTRKKGHQTDAMAGTLNMLGREEVSYGDSGGASRFFYVAKAPTKERPKVDGVAHPTVKPLALMRWLVKLVTPEGGLVLDPFLGSGTTAQAALAEGFRCIGMEMTEEYLPLIADRLKLNLDEEAQAA